MSGVRQFSGELDALINRYRREADLTFVEVIGVLEVQKLAVMQMVVQGALEKREDLEDDIDGFGN